ncbi:primosomal protein N' [Propionicicella superfundia]|uniref:primosomal protein N' n=1 Tax=Propionicicella superfundia TaxID=348582 RepID=UPI0005651421|nr:primosomal protein N' [Propionicicella superfundia]
MEGQGVVDPVASVVLDLNLPHLDREFEYAVPADLADAAVAGARVRVRFAGRLVDGFIADRRATPRHEGHLAPLHKVVSPEPVLLPETLRLLRAVADHYAGTVADLLRFAVPPRHAATERADRAAPPAPVLDISENALAAYPAGASFLTALRDGRSPRAAWQVAAVHAPLGEPFGAMVTAAQETLRSGRGAILLVGHRRDLDRLAAEVTARCGPNSFAVLAADLGPSVRYRHFLSVVRGQQRLVIGTRNAVFAPVRELGLVGIWDDGSDDYAEPHAPYPNAREVAAIRVAQQGAGILLASHSRSLEAQAWVEAGWLHDIAVRPAALRERTPVVHIAASTDFALTRDPHARSARLPREVFDTVRAGLAAGPVLVQVPLAGYVRGVVCSACGTPAACPRCGGRLQGEPWAAGIRLTCAWCGPPQTRWACRECGGRDLRTSGVGSARTAEELGRAFPGTRVITSSGDRIVDETSDEVALVVATPGAEPRAAHGYAAAVLLDTLAALNRPDLRAAEESLRRWLNAVALVRPAADGGTVLAVGPSTSGALRALVRTDPVGFATRELADRRAAGFPPAAKLITVEGPPNAVAEFAAELRLPDGAAILARTPVPASSSDDLERLTLRSARHAGRALTAEVRSAAAVRTARKDTGALRIRVDPQVLG